MKKMEKRRVGKSAVAMTLAAAMTVSSVMVVPVSAAYTDSTPTAMELANRELSRKAANEGMVLLENKNNALPIQASKVALFGGTSYKTIKGGTGSGDVNQRDVVSIYDGLKEIYDIVDQDYIAAYEAGYEDAVANAATNDYFTYVKGSFGGAPSYVAKDIDISSYIDGAKGQTDTGIYVIGRNSGEGADRSETEGDYYLTETEKNNIKLMAENFENSIVLLNVGGIIDTKFFDESEGLDSLVLVSQPGMEAGTAIAKLLTGEVSPSGKLTDTWAINYSDYPSSATFAKNDGNSLQEDYTEGIYNGYRYFDTFGIDVAYEFGYGLSYTDFAIDIDSVEADEEKVEVTATVTNTGNYDGKEVVEVYYSAPEGDLEKPYQELAAFAKTDTLQPGESQTLTINYETAEMSSYDEARAAYVMEAGDYVVRIGNSSRNTHVGAVLTLNAAVITDQLSNQMPADKELELLSNQDATPITYEGEAAEITNAKKISLTDYFFVAEAHPGAGNEDVITYVSDTTETDYLKAENVDGARAETTIGGYANAIIKDYSATYNEIIKKFDGDYSQSTLKDVYDGEISMEQFVSGLTVEEMANLVVGSRNNTNENALLNSVKGTAGETYGNYIDSKLIPNITLADGPAGVRITQSYAVGETTYYQFCTAWPIGTCLAQTWDVDLLDEVGTAVGEEMVAYGVTLWLAPGMNIHRNPLCGRNFEYYSEDPVLTGQIATATTLGVQSNPGVGVTIKHYAMNQQETSRNSQNNTASERTIREIYLKAFEMTVKQAKPAAIMTAYNVNNSRPAADDYALCTTIPREEWGFDGLVMTDWGGGKSTPGYSMHAGNDLIMPGGNPSKITDGLANLNITLGDVQKSVINILNIVMASNQFAKMFDDVEAVGYSTARADELETLISASKSTISGAEQEEKVDVANLENMLSVVEKLDADDYTEESWAALQEAVRAAKDLAAKGDATQAEIDDAYYALIGQWSKLEYGLFTKALKIAVSEAEAILADTSVSYKPESVTALKNALGAANYHLADANATQSDIDQAVNVLIQAIISMTETVDAQRLESLLDVAKGLASETKYTKTTMSALEAAIATAETVIADPNRTEAEVTSAYAGLANAIAGLKVKGDKASLSSILTIGNEILANSNMYTSSSVAGLSDAVAAALAVYNDDNASQEEVNAAAAALAEVVVKARLKGDVNSDGTVDTNDTVELLKFSAELANLSADQMDSADVNGDGVVDTNDAVMIQKYAAELVEAF